jgi:hypothetical protein
VSYVADRQAGVLVGFALVEAAAARTLGARSSRMCVPGTITAEAGSSHRHFLRLAITELCATARIAD